MSGLRPTCHDPIAALSISYWSDKPCFETVSMNTASAIGDRQIFPKNNSVSQLIFYQKLQSGIWFDWRVIYAKEVCYLTRYIPKHTNKTFFISDILRIRCSERFFRLTFIYTRRIWMNVYLYPITHYLTFISFPCFISYNLLMLTFNGFF